MFNNDNNNNNNNNQVYGAVIKTVIARVHLKFLQSGNQATRPRVKHVSKNTSRCPNATTIMLLSIIINRHFKMSN